MPDNLRKLAGGLLSVRPLGSTDIPSGAHLLQRAKARLRSNLLGYADTGGPEAQRTVRASTVTGRPGPLSERRVLGQATFLRDGGAVPASKSENRTGHGFLKGGT